MIYIGDHTTLVDQNGCPYVDNIIVFNLLSPLEGFPKLNIVPHGQLMLVEGQENVFDMQYAEYILQTGGTNELMKVLMPFYEGKDVYILTFRDNGGYFDAITESMIKFITHRYGIIPIEIFEPCDYNITPLQYNTSLSVTGLYNFDLDKEQYVRCIAREALNNGITELPEGCLY